MKTKKLLTLIAITFFILTLLPVAFAEEGDSAKAFITYCGTPVPPVPNKMKRSLPSSSLREEHLPAWPAL